MGWDVARVAETISSKFLWVRILESVILEGLEVDGRIRFKWGMEDDWNWARVMSSGGVLILAVRDL
jgi:hypothetical protein